MKVGVFEIKGWEKEYLEKAFPEETEFFETEAKAENLAENKDYETISVFVGSLLDIDLDYCKERGIQVANVPTYGENTVAEHVFALLLTLSHKIYEAYDRLREKGVYSYEGLEGFDLKGKTMGVVGTGNIGRHTIKIANGFEMKVIAYDSFPKKELESELNIEYKNSLEELLAEADVVTLHVPYLPETHHLINKDNILKMKKGVILINTARGAVVETDALVKALRSGHLGGAGLDVFEEEGAIKDEMGYLLQGEEKTDLKVLLENHILIDMNNVIVTPHSAFNTREAKERILNTTIENLKGEGKNLVS
jgi:D-lactate dehydrogenase